MCETNTEAKFHCDDSLDMLTSFVKLKICMDRFVSPIAQRYSLTPMLAMTLNIISVCDNPTVGSVFRALELNQGNVSSMCKKLEADGFIIRRKRPEDERQVTLTLTDKGREAIEGIRREIHGITFGACLTQDDFNSARSATVALSAFAEKITAAVNDIEMRKETDN